MSVEASTASFPEARPGASPRTALHDLRVAPIPIGAAKAILVPHHYLHSLPGGTQLAFGVFLGARLLGALAFGVGSTNAHRLFEGARPEDCLTLSRLWLSDELPKNAESRVLGVILRALRRHTKVKFLVTYADPGEGHVGVIYKASGWLYTGLSDATPQYDLGDGRVRHSRSLAHTFGTHSFGHFLSQGVPIRRVPQSRKHRYVYFLDPSWRSRLLVPVPPYPKKEASLGDR